MKYKILDKISVIDYLFEQQEVMQFFGDDDLEAKEIGDGNLNYVYLVSSVQDPSKALIAKQAVPYLRCVGEEFPLSKERMNYEIRALRKYKKIIPGCIPDIYYSSEDMSLLVMQYLGEHKILRYDLIDKKVFPNFSDHISTYLAHVLFYTSSLSLQSEDKRALIDDFNHNTQLCKLTEDFVFTSAFMEDETNDNDNVKDNALAQKVFNDMQFKQKVLELKYKFMTQNDALLHGDLHTGSIMLNENETYVIDPEFAFVGPFGFDIGALLANMINNYIHHHIVTKDEEYKQWLLNTTHEILEMFDEKFFDLWDAQKDSALIRDGFIDDSTLEQYKSGFLQGILQDSVGFAGCKMARRVFGVAGVQEIRGIEDKELRNQAEIMAIDIAREFVLKYDTIESIEQIIQIVKDKSER
ncbi:MAG: S-methyl-5-thioribose kinase [Campylobacterota bacterium]|nr:S-methyl-5-thioribose kinase [Campylobacterota bacterium]